MGHKGSLSVRFIHDIDCLYKMGRIWVYYEINLRVLWVTHKGHNRRIPYSLATGSLQQYGESPEVHDNAWRVLLLQNCTELFNHISCFCSNGYLYINILYILYIKLFIRDAKKNLTDTQLLIFCQVIQVKKDQLNHFNHVFTVNHLYAWKDPWGNRDMMGENVTLADLIHVLGQRSVITVQDFKYNYGRKLIIDAL